MSVNLYESNQPEGATFVLIMIECRLSAASLNLIYWSSMKQRQKSRKTSSRLANDQVPAAISNHNKQPYREVRSYLQLSDKVVHTTYETHQDPRALAEGQSL